MGIAVKENVVVGLRFNYGNSQTEQGDATSRQEQETNTKGAAVFYRRYLSLSQRFFLFGEGAVYYSNYRYDNEVTNYRSTQRNHTVGVNAYPGVAYAVSKKMHLEAGLNNLLDVSYGTGKTETVSGGSTTVTKSKGFNVATNVSASAPLTVGFRIVLGK